MGVPIDLGNWLTPLLGQYDALIERARDRLDATAGRPLRAWLRPILLAVAITIGLVALLRLLLTGLTAGGPVSRWIGAAVAGVLALILLVVVIRNVVISLIEPHQRRLLLVALLTSTAAVLVGVEAFAATSVALAERAPPLWTAERFYLWHLVDADAARHKGSPRRGRAGRSGRRRRWGSARRWFRWPPARCRRPASPRPAGAADRA